MGRRNSLAGWLAGRKKKSWRRQKGRFYLLVLLAEHTRSKRAVVKLFLRQKLMHCKIFCFQTDFHSHFLQLSLRLTREEERGEKRSQSLTWGPFFTLNLLQWSCFMGQADVEAAAVAIAAAPPWQLACYSSMLAPWYNIMTACSCDNWDNQRGSVLVHTHFMAAAAAGNQI